MRLTTVSSVVVAWNVSSSRFSLSKVYVGIVLSVPGNPISPSALTYVSWSETVPGPVEIAGVQTFLSKPTVPPYNAFTVVDRHLVAEISDRELTTGYPVGVATNQCAEVNAGAGGVTRVGSRTVGLVVGRGRETQRGDYMERPRRSGKEIDWMNPP